MRIVVCVKAVPGIVRTVKVSEKRDGLDIQAGSIIFNESDEYALEEALLLRGKHGGQATVLSMGGLLVEDVLRLALARGADRAIRVAASYYDGQRTSFVLAKALEKVGFDLVLAGMESSDSLGSQVAVGTAARMGLPFVFGVTGVAMIDDRTVSVTKELGGGSSEVLDVSLPALLCIQTGGKSISYTPPAKLIQARRRPIDMIGLAELGLASDEVCLNPTFKIIEVFSHRSARQSEILSGQTGEIARRAAAILLEKTARKA